MDTSWAKQFGLWGDTYHDSYLQVLTHSVPNTLLISLPIFMHAKLMAMLFNVAVSDM